MKPLELKKGNLGENFPIAHKFHEPISYQVMPPNRTLTVPIRYHLRGRGEPLPYLSDGKS